MTKPTIVFVVVDSQGTLVGVFKKPQAAEAAADAHCYFCTIRSTEIK